MTDTLAPTPSTGRPTDRHAHRLIFFGILLFLLGLLAGFAVPVMANPRMGLTTHLEGVMNGLFLVVLGLIWHRVALGPRGAGITLGLALYGSFANFLAVLIAAITGAGAMMPIAGGVEGTPVQEAVISFLLISLSLAMVAVSVLVLVGLWKGRAMRAR
jgi:(hydroxyamino)benzene mutase